MNKYEYDYKQIVSYILRRGEVKTGRNGKTKSIFGITLTVGLDEGFPILTSRKMFYRGVFGELAAMLRKPKSVADFENQGCNYWKLWSEDDGSLNLDYGNAWLDFNGVNQLDFVLKCLKEDRNNRRMIISGWRPDRLDELSLPCCHYAYQFYVRENRYVDMIWTQRSADLMVGVPSDVIFAAAWLIAIANEVDLLPGKVTFNFGDTHIYSEHTYQAEDYITKPIYALPEYTYDQVVGYKTIDFNPDTLKLINYKHGSTMFFDLKA